LSSLHPSRPVRPSLTAGFSAVLFGIDGHSNTPEFTGKRQLVTTGAPFLKGSIGLKISKSLYVRLDVLAGWTLSKAITQIADNEVAVYGNLVLAGAIALDLLIW